MPGRRTLQLSFITISLFAAATLTAQSPQVYVQSRHGNLREAIAHRQVVRLVSEYTLFNWLFTDTVMIDENARPHAFPVLTLNAVHIENDPRALAELVHQEIRWHLAQNETQVEQYIKEMLKRPDALVDSITSDLPPDSIVYLNLLVCALERGAINDLIGPTGLNDVWQWRLEGKQKKVYAAAEKHYDQVAGQASRFRLTLPAR